MLWIPFVGFGALSVSTTLALIPPGVAGEKLIETSQLAPKAISVADVHSLLSAEFCGKLAG